MDYDFGEGYLKDRNKPSRLRVVAAVGPDLELVDLSNQTDVYVDRTSLRIERNNENGSIATASFDLVFPNSTYPDIPTYRYIHIDDPDLVTGQGGYAGLFAGYITGVETREEGDERIARITCQDYGSLLQKPPKQITVPWPPGDGTPVVDTTVATSVLAGNDIVVTPASLRNLYVGKQIYAEEADGQNRERITIKTIDYVNGTFTADFTLPKNSYETQSPYAMHQTGLVTDIVVNDISQLRAGMVVWCYKTRGVTEKGNEWTVIESVDVPNSSFSAYFNMWKAHDWIIQARWRLVGGLTDKELIADGWWMHLDTIDELTGDIVTSLVHIDSLIDTFYTNEGLQVFKNAVQEIIPSLPHGQWTSATPQEVLDWIVEQNVDTAVRPTYHMSFKLGTSTIMSVLPPMLRYYDAYDISLLAPVALTNTSPQSFSAETMARFTEYARSEDAGQFANKLTVMGANDSIGSFTDEDSVSNTLADNYVGFVIEAQPVQDNTLITNEQCANRAAHLMSELRYNKKLRPIRVTTYAQVATFILYEPSRIDFSATWEQGLPPDFEVLRVSLSFTSEGLAQYDFQLGIRRLPWVSGTVRVPRNHRRANVLVGPKGRIESVSGPVTFYADAPHFVAGDGGADLYIAEHHLDELGNPAPPPTMYLPKASQFPGRTATFKNPITNTGIVMVEAMSRNGVADIFDTGLSEYALSPGQSVTVQSAGEHDPTQKGGVWHVIDESGVPNGTLTLWNNYIIPVPTYNPDQLKVTDGTVTGWYIKGDAVGSVQIDVRKNGVSITNGNYIELNAALENSGDVTTWDDTLLEFTNGDLMQFVVIGTPAGITKAHVALSVERAANAPGTTTIINGDVIGVTDHGELTGLGDDDHTQYFNTTRGDARYALSGHDHTTLMENPMTTIDDIIVGGVAGDPSRLPKGANSTNFGVNAAGVLGYHAPSFVGLVQRHTIALFTADTSDFHFNLGYACTITGWTMYGDVSGSIQLDVWKGTHSNWPHSAAESIVASAPPALSSTDKGRDTTLTGWTTSVGVDDTLTIHIDSFATIEKATFILHTVRA